jgi:hypothetical protein
MVMVMVMMVVMTMQVTRWDNAVITVMVVVMVVMVVILCDLFSALRLCRSDARVIYLQRIPVHRESAPGDRDNWSVACFV